MTCALALTLVLSATGKAQTSVEFGEPLHLGNETVVYGAEWFLVVDDLGTGKLVADVHAAAVGAATQLNRTVAIVDHERGRADYTVTENTGTVKGLPAQRVALRGHDASSVYGSFATGHASWDESAKIIIHPADGCLTMLLVLNRPEARYDQMCPAARGPMAVVAAPGEQLFNFTVEGSATTRVEYQGLTTSCVSSRCPPSAEMEKTAVEFMGGSLQVRNYSYVDYRFNGGVINAEGRATLLVVGGQNLNLSVNGWARLPAVSGVLECDGCQLAGNETLWAEGELEFRNLQARADEDRFHATLGGNPTSARLDENPIDPAVFGAGTAVAVAAGVGVLVVAWKLGTLALFNRVTPDRALDHPRRKRIMEYVEKRPGATFREVSRATELSAGTLRHHLNVMGRVKLVVERPHRSTLRVFPNHGKYDAIWGEVVMLRDENLREVHEFIQASPNCIQSDILEHFERLGWSRSTTQHRLQRLVDADLLDVTPQGRRKLYRLKPRARVPGPAGLLPRPVW